MAILAPRHRDSDDDCVRVGVRVRSKFPLAPPSNRTSDGPIMVVIIHFICIGCVFETLLDVLMIILY